MRPCAGSLYIFPTHLPSRSYRPRRTKELTVHNKILNPEYVASVKEALAQAPYFQLLSMTLIHMERGRTEFLIPAQEKHLNPHQGVHGGVIASLLDATCNWAAYSEAESENAFTTVELKINYLAPARAGQNLVSTGIAVKTGKSLGVAEARVIEEPSGRLVGFGTATCMILNKPMGGALANLPAKFI